MDTIYIIGLVVALACCAPVWIRAAVRLKNWREIEAQTERRREQIRWMRAEIQRSQAARESGETES